MKQNDENKDARVLSMEDLENVAGGGKKTPPPFKEQ